MTWPSIWSTVSTEIGNFTNWDIVTKSVAIIIGASIGAYVLALVLSAIAKKG